MRTTLHFPSIAAAVLCAGLLSACTSSQRNSYPDENFSSTNVYAHTFPGSGKATCEAARRALLSQGYIIGEASNVVVKGSKNFQPEPDMHMQVAFNVTCAPDSAGSNSTTVFANAVRDRYSLKKSNNSASLGVGVLGSVSLPIGMSDDSLVKVASETIPSKEFYEGFFALVVRYLDLNPEGTTSAAETPAAPAVAPVPAPVSAPASVATPASLPAPASVTAPAAAPAPSAAPAAAALPAATAPAAGLATPSVPARSVTDAPSGAALSFPKPAAPASPPPPGKE